MDQAGGELRKECAGAVVLKGVLNGIKTTMIVWVRRVTDTEPIYPSESLRKVSGPYGPDVRPSP